MEDCISAVETVNRVISDSVITIEAMKNSQEFYNTAFKNMQDSFLSFTSSINTLTITLAAITVVLVTINFISAKNGFEKQLKKQEDEFERQLKKQQEEFGKKILKL